MNLHSGILLFIAICRDIVPLFFDHLWQSSLFACAVAVLALSLRMYQARIRYSLWLAGSGKFLLPFSLLAGLGAHWSTSNHTKVGLNAVLDEASRPFTEIAVRDASIGQMPASAMTSHSWMTLLPALLAAVWFCGFVCVLMFWWLQWRRISTLMRHAEPLHEGREIEILRRLEQACGDPQALRVLSSQNAPEPGVVGVFHPALLWPAGMSLHLNDVQLKAVLAHELCHVRRRDNLTSAIQMLVAALFWFHPLVWWLGTRLIEEREQACDEEVLLHSEPAVYAESILKVCAFGVESSPMCLSGINGADLKSRIVRIMSNRARGRLGQMGKTMLAAAAIAAVAVPMAFGLMHGKMPIYGQILHAAGPLPSFEVATIRPFQPGQALPAFDRSPSVMIHGGSIKQLIGVAYNLPTLSVAQIVGAPDWAAKDQYLVQGKIDDSMNAKMQKMSPAQSLQQRELLLQSLLADRMKLKIHFETRELPMYALVVAKGGPKLHPSEEMPDSTDTVLPPPLAPGTTPSLDGLHKGFFAFLKEATFEMQAKALTLDELAEMLQRQPDAGGRLIVNQTGITGFYDCTMKWAQQLPTSERTTLPDSDEPPFFTAITEQLGLRLVPTKGPAEVIVIDHIEKPSQN